MFRTVTLLEQTFNKICTDSYPTEWDENHITFSLMKELRNIFSNRIIHFDSWTKMVNWQSFKNRGTQETKYGDIAIIVNIQFSSGEVLRGVATIEAKRIYNTGNFESIDLEQLKRIKANAPYSHLLFYLSHPTQVNLKFPNESTWTTNMLVSPINTAQELLKQTNPKDTRVLRVSFPFTSFLTSRIFWGLDLDFRKEVYDDILGGLNSLTNSSPKFLAIANVFYDGQNPVEVNLSDLWEEIK